MKPLYPPRGKAKEYGDYAVNIYTGCPHRCYYCFAPGVLHRNREEFHSHVEPRPGIVDALRKQIEREGVKGATIHLCFTCDPYPVGYDTGATREVIQVIKESGNHVQILTKGDGSRDFDLLDEQDWYGITISCNSFVAKGAEPAAISPFKRLNILKAAKKKGIKTWVSFEPVVDDDAVIGCIVSYFGHFDKIKVGKLNYHPSDINWGVFGRTVENVLRETGVEYYIKESLREEMAK